MLMVHTYIHVCMHKHMQSGGIPCLSIACNEKKWDVVKYLISQEWSKEIILEKEKYVRCFAYVVV